MQIVEALFASDGFSVVNCRVSNINGNVVLSLDSFAVDLEMELTHPRHDDFLTLHVVLDRESWVLSLESIQGFQEGVQISYLLWFDC